MIKEKLNNPFAIFLLYFYLEKIKLSLLYSLRQQNFDTCFKHESSYSKEKKTTNNLLGFL